MRRTLIASLLFGLAALAHHDGAGRKRKSLGFGPAHPHAVYRTNPSVMANSLGSNADPLGVLALFMTEHHDDDESRSFKIRPDSYFDKNTNIHHFYIRQLVNGLQVVDGDMNVNIKDGRVLSFGDSFYRGETPAPFTNPSSDNHPHRDYCRELVLEFDQRSTQVVQSGNEQTVMAFEPESHPHTAPIFDLLREQCVSAAFAYDFANTATDLTDARPALLQFMMAATPKEHVLAEILSNYDQFVDNMEVKYTTTLQADYDDKIYISNVPDALNDVVARMAYIQVPNKSGTTELQLVWKFEVEMLDNWYEAAVSATAPFRIVSVVDWASDASAPTPKKPEESSEATYNVFVWGINDPAEGNRTVVKENADKLASPAGWHALPVENDPSFTSAYRSQNKGVWRNTTTTWGNNVFAQENHEGANQFINNYRPVAEDKVFDFVYAPKKTEKTDAQAESYKHINATVAQLFYTSNLVHDLFYRYGFDEVSGNFQQHNFGRGGLGDDAVIANAQDGSGYNNANFMTPPDGQNGRMRMYLWNTAIPYRDGDFEAGIVIHELAHGISTRLTGGPANSGCLGWGESGGMGEGWGDFFATLIRSTETYSDYPMGAWAANTPKGIRNYPYSLNDTINPSTYHTLDKPGYWGVHAIGEVWAEMLWVVAQKLIAKHGYKDTLFPPQPLEDGSIPLEDFYKPSAGKSAPIPKHGNTLALQLVVTGLKLQPCRPGFFEARDAIILADQELTGGDNFCEIWSAFAERGLGQDADVKNKTPWGGGTRTDGYKVPVACKSY